MALTVIVGVCLVSAAVLFFGAFLWKSGTRELRARLEAARLPIEPKTFDKRELEGLPEPVQRYFRAALQDGQPIVAAVSVEHTVSVRGTPLVPYAWSATRAEGYPQILLKTR